MEKKSSTWQLAVILTPIIALMLAATAPCAEEPAAAAEDGAAYRPTSVEFYLHDTLTSGKEDVDTAALVAVPRGRRMDTLVDQEFHFADVVVFDDPLTAGPAVESRRVGYAQGVYVYTGRTNYSALWFFTAFLETGFHKGSLTMVGGEVILDPVRFLPVVSGTGDFHMARGMAAISTTNFIGTTFFTLFFNVSLSY